MKQFNLEAALRGEPVVTRDGRKARVLMYIPEFDPGFSLLVVVEGRGRDFVASFYEDGRVYEQQGENGLDLFMAPTKRQYTTYLVIEPSGDLFSAHDCRVDAERYCSGGRRVVELTGEVEL